MNHVLGVSFFSVGDNVVYPTHGVGQIIAEEIQVIAGTGISLYVILFSKDKMTLRVPKSKAVKTGLRHLSSESELQRAMRVLKSKAKFPKGMWSKRAQEYDSKINSGQVDLIAEVLRDLHRNVDDPDRSYSEKVIYDIALERFAHEYSIAMSLPKDETKTKILSVLNYFRD
ncbi:CarD family transcriptional regulator [Alphaproteobacteria bacterium]